VRETNVAIAKITLKVDRVIRILPIVCFEVCAGPMNARLGAETVHANVLEWVGATSAEVMQSDCQRAQK